jgi:uncharacterized membrane-anchored protein YhcB (DUF1043 family)
MNNLLENCLIVAVLLLVILIPIGLTISRSRKRKMQKNNLELQNAEKNLKASFEHQDQLDSFIIAMDPNKKMLIKMALNDYQLEQFDLSTISSCVLEEKKQGETLQLLQLILLDRNKKDYPIIFYKQHKDSEWNLKRSISTARQWKVLIDDTISHAA